uniref:Cation transporter n=1 Tax=Desulfobacca acetoxidans TaxID=60893 RepID=A0A7V6A621_9BACT
MHLPASDNFRVRLIAVGLSLTVGALLMGVKFYAAYLTGSKAILSDALESIINVVASSFATGSILVAARHPDESHPYGHGKIEYFAAGFEGALIILAAAGIVYKAWPQLIHPSPLPDLEFGFLLVLLAALVNLVLGLGLVKAGKRTHSLTLVADGQHVLTDVYTSVAVLAGLALVWYSGWFWVDGAVAVLVAANILYIGAKLMRQSFQGLMDASDPELLDEIAQVLAQHRKNAWIDIHRLRARLAGSRVLLDFHLILPRNFTLDQVHREVKELEQIFNAHFGGQADILIHTDPCDDPECPVCGYDPCKLRQEDTVRQRLWQSQVITANNEPKENPRTTATGTEQLGKVQD